MRSWKPTPDPKQEPYALTPPDEEYWEIEAAIDAGYTLGQWMAEEPLTKARMIAHHHEKRLRDAHFKDWESQQMRKAANGGTSAKDERSGKNSWLSMKQAWGIG